MPLEQAEAKQKQFDWEFMIAEEKSRERRDFSGFQIWTNSTWSNFGTFSWQKLDEQEQEQTCQQRREVEKEHLKSQIKVCHQIEDVRLLVYLVAEADLFGPDRDGFR